MSSDLFEFAENNFRTGGSISGPLASRMRPKTWEDWVGQEAILGKGKPLRQWIDSDRVPSILLWGPPGCGKTSLARMIAHQTRSHFEALSAVLSGVKELKEILIKAKEINRLSPSSVRLKTILFIDEIHRFNKNQQDALLPHIEDGTVTLIGATTENPSYEINSALLSRVRVIRFERLASSAIEQAIRRALRDPLSGLGGFLQLSEEAIRWLAETSEGDARRALTSLEAVALFVGDGNPLNLNQVQAALASSLDRQSLPYDTSEHFQLLSALIKSIRASDSQGGLYYLARMLSAGEDPLLIARRLVVFASEDVGNADPRGLLMAVAVKEAVEFVGMPEARINLAQAVTYLASAPKNRACYLGIQEALEEVQRTGALPVPLHLRN